MKEIAFQNSAGFDKVVFRHYPSSNKTFLLKDGVGAVGTVTLFSKEELEQLRDWIEDLVNDPFFMQEGKEIIHVMQRDEYGPRVISAYYKSSHPDPYHAAQQEIDRLNSDA